MITRLYSAALRGVDAQEVEVEVNARGADKPVVIIVGKTFFSCKLLEVNYLRRLM